MNRVLIEKLVFGGMGIGRTDQGIVFIEGAVPGEEVEYVPEPKTRNGVLKGTLKSILVRSPARRNPPCPYSGICGGCDWLHIAYEQQIIYKKEIFLECMRRIGHLNDIPDPEIYSSPEFGYRIRAQFQADHGRIGFYKRNTHETVEIQKCLLLADSLNRLLEQCRSEGITLSSHYLTIKVINGDTGTASLPVLPGLTTGTTVISAGKFRFEVSGDSFFQGNRYLWEKLGSWANGMVQGDFCIDLYGGSGFFSIFYASRFKKGLLVETLSSQVYEARKNFSSNRITHFSAEKGTAERISAIIPRTNVDLLIIDPPRPGLTPSARESILNVNPQKILYVSCNVSTQARDISDIITRSGYHIERTALFDLYPNTHHIESAILLSK